MFDRLFERPHALARHRAGPMRGERLAFLTQLADRGVSRNCLRQSAQKLLVFIQTFDLVTRPQRIITRDEIQRKTADRRVRSLATRWLRFLQRLEDHPVPVCPCAEKIKAFADYMEQERGLSPVTIRNRCWLVPHFLKRLGSTGSLREITPNQIDEALQGDGQPRRLCARHDSELGWRITCLLPLRGNARLVPQRTGRLHPRPAPLHPGIVADRPIMGRSAAVVRDDRRGSAG